MDLCPETCGTGCGHMLSEDLSDTARRPASKFVSPCNALGHVARCAPEAGVGRGVWVWVWVCAV